MSVVRSGLGASLFSRTRVAVLSLFLLNSDQRYYVRQVVQRVALGYGAVQRELAILSRIGILEREHEGNQVYYRANRSCPIYGELKSILVKTAGLADVLRDRLSVIEAGCRLAFVYGSFAEAKDDSGSDIDVMVVGRVSFAEVSEALSQAQAAVGREVNPTVYPVGEFRRKLSTPFLKSVLAKPKIFLIGDEHGLAELAS